MVKPEILSLWNVYKKELIRVIMIGVTACILQQN